MKIVTGPRKNSSSQPGRRKGKVNPHGLLAVEKHKVILVKPIESKVKNAKEEQIPS